MLHIIHHLKENFLSFLKMTSVVIFVSPASHTRCTKFMSHICNIWLERVNVWHVKTLYVLIIAVNFSQAAIKAFDVLIFCQRLYVLCAYFLKKGFMCLLGHVLECSSKYAHYENVNWRKFRKILRKVIWLQC